MNQNIHIVQSNNSWIESAAVEQLKRIHQLPGILKTVGMPDLHPGKAPIGASYLTHNKVYPHIIGNDIGCGIALYNTTLKAHKFHIEKTKKRFDQFEVLSDIPLDADVESYTFPITNKLGTIGSGNHFAEFQTIDQIYDLSLFESFDLNQKKIYLLVHSGSRNYGDYILDTLFNGTVPTEGINIQDPLFSPYMKAHLDALRFAHINRQLIAERILSVIQKAKPELLFESVHNSISNEIHQGEACYIHRKGAAPSNIGPLVIAGTRETPSYIVLPDPHLETYLSSVSHGAGRKWHRSGCKDRLQNKYGKKSIKQQKRPSLVCHNKSLYYEEAPDAYKNIAQVIDDLVSHKMIHVVASLKPLLTVKI